MSDSDTSLVVRGETCRRLNACFQEVEPVPYSKPVVLGLSQMKQHVTSTTLYKLG